jgi:DNA-binding NarL/FixJ family response regulator
MPSTPVRDRRDRTYDPGTADLFAEQAEERFAQLGPFGPWDAVLDLEPRPHRVLAAGGVSNGDVAERLFMSTKTADHHIQPRGR